jgi:hypothetical protein
MGEGSQNREKRMAGAKLKMNAKRAVSPSAHRFAQNLKTPRAGSKSRKSINYEQRANGVVEEF